MTLLLDPILRRFAERLPIPTMARAMLERCLNRQQLDTWFETVAEGAVHAHLAVFHAV